MSTLSAEILFMIFKEFDDFEQKVQFMLVCKNWARVLLSQYDSEHVQLSFKCMDTEMRQIREWRKSDRSTAHLVPTHQAFNPKSNDSTKSLLEKVDNSAGYGNGCKRLVLNRMNYYLADYAALSKHFPNVTHFCFNNDDDRPTQSQQPYTPDQQLLLQNWRRNLESMIVNVRTWNLFHFFDSGVFESLRTLKLHYLSVDKIDFCKELVARADNLPLDVQPAQNFESLQFPFWLLEGSPECIQYILTKYCRVKHILLQSCINKNSTATIKRRDDILLQLLPLVGDHLTKLELKLFHKPNLFSLFDLSKLEVVNADLFLSKRRVKSLFSPSKGLHAIRSLTLSLLPAIDFSIFDRLTGITQLSLNFREKMGPKFTISLNTVLNHHFPKKLETLQLGFVEILMASDDQLSFDSKIKTLILRRCEVPEKLPSYLTQNMKEMDSFSFLSSIIAPKTRTENASWRALLRETEQHLFELPDHHLSLLEIYLRADYSYPYSRMSYREDYLFPTNLQISIDKKMGYYNGKGQNLGRVNEPRPHSLKDRYLHFKCASAKKVIFNHKPIL